MAGELQLEEDLGGLLVASLLVERSGKITIIPRKAARSRAD